MMGNQIRLSKVTGRSLIGRQIATWREREIAHHLKQTPVPINRITGKVRFKTGQSKPGGSSLPPEPV